MANYPTPSQSGPPYLKYIKHRKDWTAITLVSTFEDKGVDTNESADDAPQRWAFEYDGLTETQAKVLDDFWDAHKLSVTFTLIEPRDYPWTGAPGSTITGVKFESYDDRDHSKTWSQKRAARLIKYPS